MTLGWILAAVAVRDGAVAALLAARTKLMDDSRAIPTSPRDPRNEAAPHPSSRPTRELPAGTLVADELLFSPCSAMGTVGGLRSRNEEHSA
jgi:hypothetical protein